MQGVIAIDGPAGAGKSTVARMLARRLGYLYIDTGSMYRAVAWKALQRGVSLEDAEQLISLAEQTEIRLVRDGDALRVYCDGQDVTDLIREPTVSQCVSQVAAVPGVRKRLVALQRKMASQGGVVMDGRDIGTYVLPDAPHKFYLTASLDQRTARRQKELLAKGFQVDFDRLRSEIAERDRQDKEREVAPLVQAKDAVLIDTTGLCPEQVVVKILHILQHGEAK